MAVWGAVASAISDATRSPFALRAATPVGGGGINDVYRLEGNDGRRYFLKLNAARHHPMFVAEAASLDCIAATNTLRVPQPVAHGIAGGQSYLVLERLELSPRGDARLLGEQLAALHRCRGEGFGGTQDNFIGTTPQPNGWADDWIEFWRQQRLGFQLRLAGENGYGGQLQDLGERLLDALPAFFRRLHAATLATARRPVERQPLVSGGRLPRHLRPSRLLR